MTNAELYRSAAELKAAHAAFVRATKDLSYLTWVRRTIDDPYFFALKTADTAVQPGLEIGSLVKIMTNLSGEGLYPHYAVVKEIPVRHADGADVQCSQVVLQFADKSTYTYGVAGRIYPATADESKMKKGDIKPCDIPKELVAVVLANCPLKNEGACMKGE